MPPRRNNAAAVPPPPPITNVYTAGNALPDPLDYVINISDVKGIRKLLVPEDYRLWSVQMRNVIRSAGLWDIVIGPDTIQQDPAETPANFTARNAVFLELQQNAFTGIIFAPDPVLATPILNIEKGSVAWRELQVKCEPNDSSALLALMNDFLSLQYDREAGVDVDVGKLRYLQSRLSAAGSPLPDAILATRLANAVPSIYSPTVERYFGSTRNVDLNALASVVRTAESREKAEFPKAISSNPHVFKSTKDSAKGKKHFQPYEKPKKENDKSKSSGSELSCEYCKKPGHIINHCWDLFPDRKRTFRPSAKEISIEGEDGSDQDQDQEWNFEEC